MGASSRAAGMGWDRRWPTFERGPGAAGMGGASCSRALPTRSPEGQQTSDCSPRAPGSLPLSSLSLAPAAHFFCLIRLPSIFEELPHQLGERKGLKNIGCDI